MTEDEFKKIIEKDYKDKTTKEVLDILSQREMRRYERFNFSYQRILLLEDFADLINEHKSELKHLGAKAIESMKEEVLASELLAEYVMLEIWSFYDYLLKIKQIEKIELPELPPYWETIKDFRNQIVAHLDKDEKFRTLKEWIEQLNKINEIGVSEIISDFKENYLKCCSLLKGKM